MDKIWHRGVIRYLQKKRLTTEKIHTDMVSTLEDNARALSIVKKWAAEFKRGRERLEDDPRSGRPSMATTQEIIDRIHQMVMNDRRLTINYLASVISISRERVENILRNELGMSKVLAQWVPRLLTPDQKLTRLVMSETNLVRFEADPDRFVKRFLTQDECWVHHFDSDTKKQSMQWKYSTSPSPKKAKVVSSAGKVMASIFWNAKGILFIDYLQRGKVSMENIMPNF